MSGVSPLSFAEIARRSTATEIAKVLYISERTAKRYRKGKYPQCDVIATAAAAKQLDAIDFAKTHLETVCPVFQMLMGMKKAAYLH